MVFQFYYREVNGYNHIHGSFETYTLHVVFDEFNNTKGNPCIFFLADFFLFLMDTFVKKGEAIAIIK